MASFAAEAMASLNSASALRLASASSTAKTSIPTNCSSPWCLPDPLLSSSPSPAPLACHAFTSDRSSATKSDEYNRVMQRQMLNPYEYHHELGSKMGGSAPRSRFRVGFVLERPSSVTWSGARGIYYTRILDNLIVGSQPQTPQDIDRLYHEEGVTAVLNLQQDKDIEYWGVDLNSIEKRCDELGIRYMKNPTIDFDPNSLRNVLPKGVSLLDSAISEGKTVYVHCTAGLGRAPAVAIAYLFWFHGMTMDNAYDFLTSKRPCGPRKEAIRGATYDLAKNDPWKEPFEQLPEHAFTDVAVWERQLIQDRVRGL